MPSRCALPRIAVGVHPIFKLITPVGVLPLANSLSILTSSRDHGSRMLRLYPGCALRGPFRPIGEPDRFHAALRTVFAIANLLSIQRLIRKQSEVQCSAAATVPVCRCRFSSPAFEPVSGLRRQVSHPRLPPERL